jgi:putative ABC transport system permease protein
MFFRLLFESFRRQKRRKGVALLAIALGMTIATAMVAVANSVGDKIDEDLRRNGGNLLITPIDDTLDVSIGGVNLKPASEGNFIAESDLPKMKGTFWGHNIKGFVPYLNAPQQIIINGRNLKAELIGTYFAQPLHYGKENFTTGARSVNGWWKVEGQWPEDYATWPEMARLECSLAALWRKKPGCGSAIKSK